uniref:Secreted protein n=1 Tax=Knipowitschia caucasica TaxID=637954 RepID=A0AAV2KQT0_KNICA
MIRRMQYRCVIYCILLSSVLIQYILDWICHALLEQDEDSLHYAALNVQSSSRRQRVTAQTDCVYSRVHL